VVLVWVEEATGDRLCSRDCNSIGSPLDRHKRTLGRVLLWELDLFLTILKVSELLLKDILLLG